RLARRQPLRHPRGASVSSNPRFNRLTFHPWTQPWFDVDCITRLSMTSGAQRYLGGGKIQNKYMNSLGSAVHLEGDFIDAGSQFAPTWSILGRLAALNVTGM